MADIFTLSPAARPTKKQDLSTVLLKHCVDTATLAGRPLSLSLVRDILRSAPRGREDLASDAWAAESLCWNCVKASEVRADAGTIPDADFVRILDFWSKSFAGQDAGLRSIVLSMLDLLIDAFGAGASLPGAPAAAASNGPYWIDYLTGKAPIPRYLYEPGRKWQKPVEPDDKK